MNNPQYLGDGVYIREMPDGNLQLYLFDGFREYNEIVLEQRVVEWLLAYINEFLTTDRVLE